MKKSYLFLASLTALILVIGISGKALLQPAPPPLPPQPPQSPPPSQKPPEKPPLPKEKAASPNPESLQPKPPEKPPLPKEKATSPNPESLQPKPPEKPSLPKEKTTSPNPESLLPKPPEKPSLPKEKVTLPNPESLQPSQKTPEKPSLPSEKVALPDPDNLLDIAANLVINKYQNTSCEELAKMKPQSHQGSQTAGTPEAAIQAKAIEMLRNNPEMRKKLINRVAPPIANKMFDCKVIP